MKKFVTFLVLTSLLIFSVQGDVPALDAKTAVTHVNTSMTEYSEFVSYENRTYNGLKVTVELTGEIWNSANNVVDIPFGSSSCPDFGRMESNFSLSFISLPIMVACTDDYGVASYQPGLTDLSDEFSILFENQTLDAKINGSMHLSFPMNNLLEANIYSATVILTNSVINVEFEDLPDGWGKISSDVSDNSDAVLELGLTGLQTALVMSSSFILIILIKKNHGN